MNEKRKISQEKVSLRPLEARDLRPLFELLYGPQADKGWMAFNAPYFQDPVLSWPAFVELYRQRYLGQAGRAQAILVDGKIAGMVTAHFEDHPLDRWLELGLVIAKQDQWGQGIGQWALRAWITVLFNYYPDLPHLGLTTWSGNPAMMALAEKVGLRCEGRIRQVRHWQGRDYDSVKYGLLRLEWLAREENGD